MSARSDRAAFAVHRRPAQTLEHERRDGRDAEHDGERSQELVSLVHRGSEPRPRFRR
jgi:hypothetical protein